MTPDDQTPSASKRDHARTSALAQARALVERMSRFDPLSVLAWVKLDNMIWDPDTYRG